MACRGHTDAGPSLKLDSSSEAISGWKATDWQYNQSFGAKHSFLWHSLILVNPNPSDPNCEPGGAVRRRSWRRDCARRGTDYCLLKETPSLHSMSYQELTLMRQQAGSEEERAVIEKVLATVREINEAEDEVRRAGQGAMSNQLNALETVVTQISQTRQDVRRLQAMDARLSESERLLVKLEGSSMFSINTSKEKPLKAPPAGNKPKLKPNPNPKPKPKPNLDPAAVTCSNYCCKSRYE